VGRGVRLLRLDYLRCQGSPGLHNRTDADKDESVSRDERLIELAKSSLGRFRRNYPADSAKNLPGIPIGGSDLFSSEPPRISVPSVMIRIAWPFCGRSGV
jgi:hypothetical protein